MPIKDRVWSELFSRQPVAKWVDGPRRHSFVEPTTERVMRPVQL